MSGSSKPSKSPRPAWQPQEGESRRATACHEQAQEQDREATVTPLVARWSLENPWKEIAHDRILEARSPRNPPVGNFPARPRHRAGIRRRLFEVGPFPAEAAALKTLIDDYKLEWHKKDENGRVIDVHLEVPRYDDGALGVAGTFLQLEGMSIAWSRITDAGLEKLPVLKICRC